MTPVRAHESACSDLSTTTVLRGLTAELREVVADCRALEIVVGEIFASLPQGHLLSQLQAFDLIIQRIDGAGVALQALADHAPIAWVPAGVVLGEVSLADLASRLSGQSVSRRSEPSGVAELW